MAGNPIGLIGWLGVGGFILGIINLYLLWVKHRKDKPIIKIEKNIYKKYKKFANLDNKEYTQKAIQGDFNDGSHNNEVRELVVNITNEGHRDAKLKSILPLYETEENPFSPKVINFHPITIVTGDREEVHLFFEFLPKTIKEIEKSLSNVINITFDFAHKKIRKRFVIGKYPIK